MKHQAQMLGDRLHLQHGPIDLIIGVSARSGSERRAAYEAADARFATVLDELVGELSLLRQPLGARPDGTVAQRMWAAVAPHRGVFVTPMAAVAGAVADEVLQAMCDAARLDRAYVNNGGDCAIWLGPGQQFTTAMQDTGGAALGRIEIGAGDGIGGIATSGRHGRSLSLGIADSVTVLAKTAAAADAAATLIANAVDLPGHPAITRRPAQALSEESDLGKMPVVIGCAALSEKDRAAALAPGLFRAETYRNDGNIIAASLHLQGDARQTGPNYIQTDERREYA